jgi:hypothetical protein
VLDIPYHFQNKPVVIKDIFNKLISVVKQIGKVNINVVSSAILLKKNTTYIEIKPRKEYLLIAFYLAGERKEFPVSRSLRISRQRVVHTIHLQHPGDIDDTVIGLLRESYSLID